MWKKLFILVFVMKIGYGAVLSSYRVEDAAFWRNNAESYLKKVLAQLDEENHTKSRTAKNIIIFIGDGMGMSTITASRIFKGQLQGRSGEEENLAFEMFPNVGLAKTYNVNKQVPDSAGTATALFTGVKTNYGVLGLDATLNINSSSQGRVTSIMDWAIAAGKRTGFVTTTRVTHATPAALYAHSPTRDYECDRAVPIEIRSTMPDIARQLVENAPGNLLNVILAGGKIVMGSKDKIRISDQPKFNGSSEKVCVREDGRNLIDKWLKYGIDKSEKRLFVKNTAQLMAADTSKLDYLLGLFADNHLSFSSVRDIGPAGEPSLREMTHKAIQLLQRDKSNGFVLMIEGGRIDQAHHQNHAHLALQETIELEASILEALNATSRTDTLIIVTADHSHAMTLNGYPERGNDILGYANKKDIQPYETLTYANGPGFWAHRLNESMEDTGRDETWLRVETIPDSIRKSPLYQHQAMLYLEDETHGGEDVPVYSIGPGSQFIRGAFEQNYIAYVMSYAGCMGPARRLNKECCSSCYSIKSSVYFLVLAVTMAFRYYC